MKAIEKCAFYLHFLRVFIKDSRLATDQLNEIKKFFNNFEVNDNTSEIKLATESIYSAIIKYIIQSTDFRLDEITTYLRSRHPKLLLEVKSNFVELCDTILTINAIMESMFLDGQPYIDEIQIETLYSELRSYNIFPENLAQTTDFIEKIKKILAGENTDIFNQPHLLRDISLQKSLFYLEQNKIKKEDHPNSFPEGFPIELVEELYSLQIQSQILQQSSQESLQTTEELLDQTLFSPTSSRYSDSFCYADDPNTLYALHKPVLNNSPEDRKRKRKNETDLENIDPAIEDFTNKLKAKLFEYGLLNGIEAIETNESSIIIIFKINSSEDEAAVEVKVAAFNAIAASLTDKFLADSFTIHPLCRVTKEQNKVFFEIEIFDSSQITKLFTEYLNEALIYSSKPSKVRRELFAPEQNQDSDFTLGSVTNSNNSDAGNYSGFFSMKNAMQETQLVEDKFPDEIKEQLDEKLESFDVVEIKKGNDSIIIKFNVLPIIKNHQLFLENLSKLLEVGINQQDILCFMDKSDKQILIQPTNATGVSLLYDLLIETFPECESTFTITVRN